MVNKGVKKIALTFLSASGINGLFRIFGSRKALILWYHGICDDSFDLLKGYDERHIPVSLFRKQVSYLKARGYRFVTLTELLRRKENGGKIGKLAVLTFDDGFKNVIKNAYPVMREYGAKGCIYIPSALVGSGALLWTDYVETVIRNADKGDFVFIFKKREIRYSLDTKSSYKYVMKDIKRKLKTIPRREREEHLRQFDRITLNDIPDEFRIVDWEEVERLDKNILEVGVHTRSHADCTMLSDADEIREEIADPKREIERKVGYPVDHFCYPGGAFNEKAVQILKEHGYRSAVTIMPGFVNKQDSVFKLRRMVTTEDMLFFKASVSGSYYFISRLLKMFKGIK